MDVSLFCFVFVLDGEPPNLPEESMPPGRVKGPIFFPFDLLLFQTLFSLPTFPFFFPSNGANCTFYGVL